MLDVDAYLSFCPQAGVVSSMKEIRRNRTYYANKKAKESKGKSVDDSDTVEKKLEKVKKELQAEMSKQQPSIIVMRDILNANRQLRMAHAKAKHYRIHILYFPCLRRDEMVSFILIFLCVCFYS